MTAVHDHVFLGSGQAENERRTWWVVGLCTVVMVVEIVGGWLFGSLALIADGLHMSTHAGALLLAALAYRFARNHARDPRFTFGTGKLGDLAGYTSAIILAGIALLIGFEAISRLLAPVPIHFAEAIPIAALGLVVNVSSAALLSGGHHHHHHDHDDDHDDHDHDHHHHDHDRDNNMRAALVHVFADAAVSVLVIAGLLLAWRFGWLWIDPVVGIVGAVVIASWAATLIRATGAILLDMNPDAALSAKLRAVVESEGDELADLHLWRLGPGHLGAIVAVRTSSAREAAHYRARLLAVATLSHLTVEVHPHQG